MKKKIRYTCEPKDGIELPESGVEVIVRSRQRAAGLPALDASGTQYDISESGNLVTLTPRRGGLRVGAGRKSAAHVRMQILISPATRKKIEAFAKRRKVTLSQAVEHMAALA